MTKFKITQEILDYIGEHSANFSEITPSPILGEEWIVKDIKTYPSVNNGNSVVEAEREDGCYIRLPENIVKIYTIDKEQTGKFGLKEEPVSEDFEDALANEWKAYNDRCAATVDALEDNTQELAFAKGFYRGSNWQKQQDQSTIELAEDHAMLAGMEKMKEEMMEKAIDVEVKVDAGGYPYVYKHIELYDYDKDVSLAKEGDKYKVILIKEG